MAYDLSPAKHHPVAMMRFDKIPVDINGKNQLLNFRRLDEDAGGIWIASTDTKRLYIDDDLNFQNFSMPQHWVAPVIEALKIILLKKLSGAGIA